MPHRNKQKGKQFERECAAFVGGFRYPADTGGRVDVESQLVVAQCKKTKGLSHQQLANLALEMQREGYARNKLGVVLHQVPPGPGRKGIGLITFTWEMCDEYYSFRSSPVWLSSNEQDEESDGE